MQAAVLVDNIGTDGLTGEWGLGFYIVYDGVKILLDTGSSGLFLENAEKLGIHLEDTDYAVLSHAHYDHANGMAAFFNKAGKAKFYLRRGCAENCYSKRQFYYKYIGLPKRVLRRYSDRIVYVDGDYELCPGVTLVPHKTKGLEELGKINKLYVRENGCFRADGFAHEQSLVFRTDSGLVIFNSCSHAGADNIISEVSQTYPDQKIRALVGGFHLYRRTDEDIRALAERIRNTGIEEIYTGHCTGQHAYGILKEELGDSVHQLYAGRVMKF
ncbi:MAG TPA: MBL fold metallo-hydrolase [Candidatus Choladousia intestinipullorum]|nr:MBL fold metallo-hydrolase [Candidatus Choladousia intestinipullorum]